MNPFVQNVARVLTGTFVAQAIVVLLTPALTRLFPPDAFAIAQSFTSFMSFMVIVGSLRYDVVLTVVEEDHVRPLLLLCVTCSLLTSIACGLIVGFGSDLAPAGWQLKQFKDLGLIAFAAAALVSTTNALIMVTIRDHRFGVVAKSKIAQSGVFVFAALLIGRLTSIRTGLVIADLPGRLAAAGVLSAAVLSRPKMLNLTQDSTRVWALLKRYRRFPFISLPAGILGSLSVAFNTVYMLALFDVRTAGLYAVVERGISMPVGVLGNAVAQVYQGQLSESLRTAPHRAASEFRRLLVSQIKIAVGPAFLLMIFAPTFIPIVLGERWREAGVFCEILTPFLFVSFVSTPFSFVLLLLEKQRNQLGWEIFRFTLMIGTWYLAHRLSFTPRQALIAVSASGSVVYIVFLTIAHNEIVRHAIRVVRVPGDL